MSFAVPQFLISNFVNPWIVDIGASHVLMACLIVFLPGLAPAEIWTSPALRTHNSSAGTMPPRDAKPSRPATREEVIWSWMPWVILSLVVAIWGTP